jgi:hypothetical protein
MAQKGRFDPSPRRRRMPALCAIPSVAALTGNDRGRRLLPTACVGGDVRFAALLASVPLDGFGRQPSYPERGGTSIITWPMVARR